MIRYLLVFIFLGHTASSYSQDESEDCIDSTKTPLSAFAEDIQIPNCAEFKILKKAKAGDFSDLCVTCQPKYNESLKKLGVPAGKEDTETLKEKLTGEFKKAISANLLDITKLRSTAMVSGDFSSAISACSIDKLSSELSKNPCTSNVDLETIKTEVANEVAQIISASPATTNGLLDRSNAKNSCASPTSDANILQAMAETLQEELTDDKILLLKSIDPNLPVEERIVELFPNSIIPTLLKSHPVFSNLMSKPKDFVSFFKSTPKGLTASSLASRISDDKNSNTIKSIADKCNTSFSAFKSGMCSKDLQNGKANFDSLNDALPFLGRINASKNKFLDTENAQQFDTNEKIKKFCSFKPSPSSFNLSKTLSDLHFGMPNDYAIVPYSEYKSTRYDAEIGNIRRAACLMGDNCDVKDINCRISRKLTDIFNPSTASGRLAKTSDESVNQILRSLIGTPKNISSQTRDVLVKANILPGSDGKIVSQPEIPERKKSASSTDYASTSSATSQQFAQAQAVSAAPQQNTNYRAPKTTAATQSESSTSSETVARASALSRSIDNSQDQLDQINKDILERLSKKPATSQVSRAEFQQATREANRKQNSPLSSAQEEAFVNNYYPQESTVTTPTAQAQTSRSNFGGKAPTRDEVLAKLSNQQRNAALANFAGSRDRDGSGVEVASEGSTKQASRSPSSATDIGVSIPENGAQLAEVIKPQLSDLKMMIERGEDFTFKIKQSTNDAVFKIMKGSQSSFQVVFLSGDAKTGSLYKNQLQSILDGLTTRATRKALQEALTIR